MKMFPVGRYRTTNEAITFSTSTRFCHSPYADEQTACSSTSRHIFFLPTPWPSPRKMRIILANINQYMRSLRRPCAAKLYIHTTNYNKLYIHERL